MNAKLDILYERLSHEDGRENESLSIENQKAYLEEYAIKHGFTNFVHMADDGWSGTRWDRPAFLKMMDEIERGNVRTILIKEAYVKQKLKNLEKYFSDLDYKTVLLDWKVRFTVYIADNPKNIYAMCCKNGLTRRNSRRLRCGSRNWRANFPK